MTVSGFLRAGHWPTLLAAFLYFDVSFMVWVILGPLGPFLTESLKLSASQKGLLIATPLLAGSIFRPILGALADRIGGRPTALLGLGLTLLPLITGWKLATTLEGFFVVAVLLGVAGASFAVALPLASRWYPPEYQGLAMGIAGAGNSGTVLATLFAPRLASSLGWGNVFGLALIPVLLVIIVFAFMAKDAPVVRKQNTWADYRKLFAESDTSWFCLFYSITFGGFVGLASFLTVFFFDQYHLSKVQAGDFATIAVICGSFLRPVGGWLSDRIGGYRMLLGVLLISAASILGLSTLPGAWTALALFAFTMALFGMGNGAIFQLVPQRFGAQVGLITGLVGAAGGIGGFLLPSMFGMLKDKTGSFAAGLSFFACFILFGFSVLLLLGPVWMRNWHPSVVERAGLFSYRGKLAEELE